MSIASRWWLATSAWALAAGILGPADAAAQRAALGTPTLEDSPVYGASAWVPGHGGFSLRGFYSRIVTEESEGGDTARIDEDFFFARGAFGIGSRLAVGATVPFHRFSFETDGPIEEDEDSGLGDASVFADFQVARSAEGRTALTAIGEFTFSSGADEVGAGQTSRMGLGGAVSHRMDRVTLHGAAGVSIPSDDDFENVVDYSAALVVRAGERFRLSGELVGSKLMEDAADAETLLGLGARATLGSALLDGGVLFGVGDAAPDYSIAVALTVVR